MHTLQLYIKGPDRIKKNIDKVWKKGGFNVKFFMWIFATMAMLWTANVNACSDLNGNGDVDIADFLIFVDDYGKSVTRSDFNDDDIVDIADFLIFVDDYGKSVTCNQQDEVEPILVEIVEAPM